MTRRSPAILLVALAAAATPALAGCGDEAKPIAENRGAQLFSERCSGCHTLSAAGARGSVSGERPTGPNLDKRTLTKDEALFAIRNGGFSGAIMPQNIVVGKDAEAVAGFLAEYAGGKSGGSPGATSTAAEGAR